MHSYGTFTAVNDSFSFSRQFPNKFTDDLTAFVHQHRNEIKVFGSSQLSDTALASKRDDTFIIAIGDQMVRFPVREIRTREHAADMYSSYASGNLMGVTYLLLPEKLRSALVDVLDRAERPDHNVPRAHIVVHKLSGVSDRAIVETFDIPDSHAAQVAELAQGNFGAGEALSQLLKCGAEIFEAVAPKLGRGTEIWEKYNDECRKDVDELIRRYR